MWMLIAASVAMPLLLRNDQLLDFIGLALIASGLILTAVDLAELHSGGLLDQIRLSGRPPRSFLIGYLLQTAGPWVAIGLLATTLSRWAPGPIRPLSETIVVIGAFVGAAAAIARFGLNGQSIDRRVAVAVPMVGGITALRTWRPTLSWPDDPAIGSLLIAIEWMCVAWVAMPLVSEIKYPPAITVTRGPKLRFRLRGWMLAWPGFFRSASLTLNGVVVLLLLGPPVIAMRWFGVATPSTSVFVLPPLAIGLLVIPATTREDAVSGRLAIIRQDSVRPQRTSIEMVAGLWAPYVVSALAITVTASALFPVEWSLVGLSILGLLAAAPVPVIEGWMRHGPGTYSLAYCLALPFGLRSSFVLLMLGALQWFAVSRKFTAPDRAVLRGWAGVAVPGVISGACAIVAVPVVVAIATSLFAVSPLLLDAEISRRQLWRGMIGVAAGTAGAATFIHGAGPSAAIAVSAAATWLAASRIITALPTRPLAQSAVRLAIMATLMAVAVGLDPTGSGSGAANGSALFLVQGLGIAVAAEVAARFAAAVAPTLWRLFARGG
jgi:hypothetical protein